MKITFRQRVFIYFFIIFTLFTVAVIIVEQKDESRYKTETLEAQLDGYAEIINAYIKVNNLNDSSITTLRKLIDILPKDIRITLIAPDGKVFYDKDIQDVSHLENHLDRPEIRMALFQFHGTNIRVSASTKHEYLYYAKSYPNYFVRVALPYNIETRSLLKADNLFIYVVLSLFLIVLILLIYASGYFGKSINILTKLTSDIKENKPIPQNIDFPNDELGDIGYQLIDILKQKEKSHLDIEQEREKLIQHFQYSGEGLGIFNANFEKIYTNTHFIQYLNLIANKPTFDANSIFHIQEFKPISDFLKNEKNDQNYYLFNINANGKIFQIRTVAFEDKSFEISIRDISKIEKTRLLKQEMTNNIAHELRTPVASLRGYLETLEENNLSEDKQKQFINRAYLQSIRLSNLIEDISLISKMEEAETRFTTEKVNLAQVVNEVRIDLSDKLIKNNIILESTLREDLSINGNYTLLYSIFRNLIDNSINYGGPNIEIHINNYMEDNNYLYFSYYDTGKGVEEQHLNRLFERFYRVDKGRTRDSGGSGLGLSIVRNAIVLHKGEIQSKLHEGGGLEFLFTLKK